jgi:hypothetical protein
VEVEEEVGCMQSPEWYGFVETDVMNELRKFEDFAASINDDSSLWRTSVLLAAWGGRGRERGAEEDEEEEEDEEDEVEEKRNIGSSGRGGGGAYNHFPRTTTAFDIGGGGCGPLSKSR